MDDLNMLNANSKLLSGLKEDGEITTVGSSISNYKSEGSISSDGTEIFHSTMYAELETETSEIISMTVKVEVPIYLSLNEDLQTTAAQMFLDSTMNHIQPLFYTSLEEKTNYLMIFLKAILIQPAENSIIIILKLD